MAQTSTVLPPELWATVIDNLNDFSSLTALFRANWQLRSLGERMRWAGVRSLSLATSSDPDALKDTRTGAVIPSRTLSQELLPHCSALEGLSLGVQGTHDGPLTDEPAKPAATSNHLRYLIRTPWVRQPALATLCLHEGFAAAPEAPALIAAFASTLKALSVTGCQVTGPKNPSKLWSAIKRCEGLESLSFGFCKGEQSTEALVCAGLANKASLAHLTLRGLTRLTPAGLLAALNGIKAKNLQTLSFESIPYTNEVFMEASLGSDEARAAFARLHRFRMAKCGYIFAPLVLSVMPSLKALEVSLVEMSEVVKLALSFVVEYAGNTDKPRHELILLNDLSHATMCNFAADELLENGRIAIRDIVRKFSLHFDVSLAELPHPNPETGDVLAKRFVMGKGRAQVYMDTFFKYNRSLAVPQL